MSCQNKDANGSLKEILHMVRINNYNMKIYIKLKTGRIIHFKL